MAWIESHQGLARHPKLLRLTRLLKVNPAQAIGHLHMLWWWALDYAPNGDVSAFAADELADAAGWTADAEPFVAALRECRWLDPDGFIHDWEDYAGRIVGLREGNRDRQRRRREQRRQGAVTRDKPVTSRVRHGAESRTGHGAVNPESHAAVAHPVTGLPNPTQPNQTQPNPTGVCVHTPSRACVPSDGDAETHTPGTETESARSGKPEARAAELWPTLEEALARADLRGIPRECAEKWWHEHDARGGCDKHGQPLKRWESALSGFATAWRSVESQERARGRPGSSPPQRAPIDWSKGFWGDAKPTTP